jgi:hypothetical protein
MSEIYTPAHRGQNHIDVLPETDFDVKMTNEIEPLLQRYRNKGHLTIVRGIRIHYEYYLCADLEKIIASVGRRTPSADDGSFGLRKKMREEFLFVG